MPGDYKQNFLAQADFFEAQRDSASASGHPEVPSPARIEENGSHNDISDRRATSTDFEDPFSGLENTVSSGAEHSQEIWNDYKRKIEAKALDLGRRERHFGREGSGREEVVHSRPKRLESSVVCSPASSEDGRLVDTSPGAFGASHGGRKGQGRSDHNASGTYYTEPDDTPSAHARSRISSFRARRAFAWQSRGQHHTRSEHQELKQSVRHLGIAVLRGIESDHEKESSRSRWLAAALRRAYDLNWVPTSLVINIADIEMDRERRAVILVLRSGTHIVDRHTRIDVVGTADDVAVSELVAAVQRRGWHAVKLYGDDDFKRAAAAQLGSLDPPVLVQNDPPVEPSYNSSTRPSL